MNYWANIPGGIFTFNYNTSTIVLNNTQMGGISNSNTFYNLTINGLNDKTINGEYNIYGNNTIVNNLVIAGYNNTGTRVLIKSNTLGTPRTITCNGTTNITNCDFQDITLAGSANRDFSSQSDIGNCGGNTGITFPAALNLYIVHTSGAMSVSNAAKWKLADMTSAGRVPLPQDSAFGVAGSFTGASTVTMDCPRIGSIDLSGVDRAVEWTLGNALSCYGHYVLGNNITPSGNFAITEMTRTAANVNLYGKTIYDLVINAFGGTVTFLSSFIFRLFTQTNGTIVMGSYLFESNLITALTAWTYTAGTVTPGTSTIKLNPISGSANITFAGGGKTFNIVQFSGSHTGNFDITGSNTFAQLIIDPGRKVRITGSTTQTIAPTGCLVAIGTPASRITLSTVTGTATFAYSGTGYHQMNDVDFSNLIFTANRFYMGKRSTQTNCTNLKVQYAKTPQIVMM